MKTEIFADFSAFVARSDKSVNGVTQAFADTNPGWDEERGNRGCWNCSRCSDCSDCSGCSDCSDCSGCWDCSDCSGCSGCWGCSRCSDCSGCSGVMGRKDQTGQHTATVRPAVPTIPNIHQAVLAAVTATPEAFDMSNWHTCETTHCRGGWVVQLAGEAGKALEAFHDTPLAAYLIYKASSPIKVSFPRFYEDDETAMADIKRCAEEEKNAA